MRDFTPGLVAAVSALMLTACTTPAPSALDPMVRDAGVYVHQPVYDHVMVCNLQHDDLDKCEQALKQLCGERDFVDLRIRALRAPGTPVQNAAHRLLQVQCTPEAAAPAL